MKRELDLNNIWNKTIERAQRIISSTEIEDFKHIMESTRFAEVDSESRGVIVVNDRFKKVLLVSTFLETVQEAFNVVTNSEKIRLVAIDASGFEESSKDKKLEEIVKENVIEDSNLVKRFTFENFVVTKHNRFLVNAAKAVALRPGTDIGNPFFIFGDSGLGKTHLVNAMGNEIRNKNNVLTVKYIEAKEFAKIVSGAFSSAKRSDVYSKVESIKDNLSSFDVLIFDDIQFLETKAATKEIFFHIFDDLLMKEKQVVITADRHPEEMPGFEDRIRTRFLQGFYEGLFPPDTETSKAIVRQKIQDRWPAGQELFEDEAVDFIGVNFAKNVRGLESAVNRIVLFFEGASEKVKIDLDIVTEIFKGMRKVGKGRTPKTIISTVAQYYGVPVSEIMGTSRIKQIALARQVSIYLIKETLNETVVNIAYEFKKDHSTIISSINKIKKLAESDEMHRVITDIRRKIG